MDQYQILPLLQGRWREDPSGISFEIVGNDVINIKGATLDSSILKLQWADKLTTWQINIPFFEAHYGYVKYINESYFEVLNLTVLVTDPHFELGIDISERNKVFRFKREF